MPKIKTKSSAKKRFKLTGSGRIKRKQAGKRHLMVGKTSKVSRRLRQNAMVHPSDMKNILRCLVVA